MSLAYDLDLYHLFFNDLGLLLDANVDGTLKA